MILWKKMPLDGKVRPLRIRNLCRGAVDILGKRFEAQQYFLPEWTAAVDDAKKLDRVLMDSILGDLLSMWKNVAAFIPDINGYKVKDIRVEAPVQPFKDEINAFQPDIVAFLAFCPSLSIR